jgi:hypothetical protein
MVINSWVKTKVRWYQQGWFKIVLQIVALVIAVVTAQYWLVGLMAALETGAMAVVLYVLESVLIAMAVNILVDFVIDTWGAKIGIIVAIVGVIASAIIPNTSGFTLLTNTLIPTSQMVLQISTTLVSTANEWILEETEKVKNEYADFSSRLSDRFAELRTLEENNLGNQMDIDPLMFTGPPRFRSIGIESPDAMIMRSLNIAENTYAMASTACSEFADRALTPKRNITTQLYHTNLRV